LLHPVPYPEKEDATMSVDDYSTNPNNNSAISGINIAEGCPPSNVNNAIRQLMADVKAKTTSIDSSISTLDSGALKKSGGVMTGAIKSDVQPAMTSNSNTGLRLCGDSSWDEGARLALLSEDGGGNFYLSAIKSDGTGVFVTLGGNADTGQLAWNNQEIPTVALTGLLANLTTTAKNNLVAAINEVKSLIPGGGSFLPLGGGTMSGTIKSDVQPAMAANSGTGLRLAGGSTWNNGSRLALRNTSGGGGFTISAIQSNSTFVSLIGDANGGLTWDSKPVLLAGDTLFPTVKDAVISDNKLYAPSGGTWWCTGHYVINSTYEYFVNASYAGGAGIYTNVGTISIVSHVACIRIA